MCVATPLNWGGGTVLDDALLREGAATDLEPSSVGALAGTLLREGADTDVEASSDGV